MQVEESQEEEAEGWEVLVEAVHHTVDNNVGNAAEEDSCADGAAGHPFVARTAKGDGEACNAGAATVGLRRWGGAAAGHNIECLLLPLLLLLLPPLLLPFLARYSVCAASA
jgi:hypothetical protein